MNSSKKPPKKNAVGYISYPMKVFDFLYKIGFTEDDVREFCQIESDGFDGNGNPFFGNDIISAKTYEDDKYVHIEETGELIEDYWAKAWIGDDGHFRRINFESYKGRYYKAFPTRYRINSFKLTKSLRRVLNKNRDLKTIVRPLRITPEKCDLFDVHYYARHGKPPHESLRKTYQFIFNDVTQKRELCIFKKNKLVACSIFEEAYYALWSHLAFWDINEAARSLGILTILLEIEYAKRQEMLFYYLGHFYAQNPNYYYKTRFGGLELFDWDSENWFPFGHPKTIELLKQKLPRWKEGE